MSDYLLVSTKRETNQITLNYLFLLVDDLRIWSHLLKKSLMENFIYCAVCILKIMLFLCDYSKYIKSLHCQYSHKLFNMILHCNRNVFFNSVSYFFGGLRCSVKNIRANKLDFFLDSLPTVSQLLIFDRFHIYL